MRALQLGLIAPLSRILGSAAVLLLAVVTGVWSQTALGVGRHQVARSTAGVVVAAHPLAAQAGARILEQGGNAADAAVAAAFAVSVVRPSMNSIGGRNQILIRSSDGSVYGIDGTTQVPEGYDPATAPQASYGYATIGVPGALAGLMRLYEDHGSLQLEAIMEPAIELAENGFRLLPGQAIFHAMSARQIAESEGARMYYLKPDGSPFRAGELLRQPDLAQTLRTISHGRAEVFYRGEIADAIVADMEANEGFVNRSSLANYRAEDARIVRGSYRGYDLIGMDVPSTGALAIQSLQIMENFDRSDFAVEEWAVLTARAIGLTVADFLRLGSDTAAIRATSKQWAAEQAQRIEAEGSNQSTGELQPEAAAAHDGGYTTHLSVADSTGMVVSLTQTIGPAMGSKVVTPGLGFLYATTLGGYLGGEMLPGARARSFITPFIVLRDGEPALVLGAAGGMRILSAVVQAVTRVVDDEMDLAQALSAPRIHPTFDSTFALTGVAMETVPGRGWTDEQVDAVEETGLRVSTTERLGAFGRIHGIMRDPVLGVWIAVADPGGEGTAVALGGR
ncbi:MAG: gamma-glutamyltransferase [Gemmatimonadota bacterium]|nr:MAG: gamma-glutamyltransferase [Gemmatimonadota bacterium]